MEAFLSRYANHLRLTEPERVDPTNNLRPWPQASALLTNDDARGAPWLSGTARDALDLLEAIWYQDLSRVAHQQAPAIATAFAGERMTAAERRQAVGNVFLPGALFYLCLLSEVDRAGRWPRGPLTELRSAWGLMSTALAPAIQLLALRYSDDLDFWAEPPDLDENWEGRLG